MVERVLCKHEVVGSNPSGSTTPPHPEAPARRASKGAIASERLTEFQRTSVQLVDTVNEGFARRLHAFRADLEKTLSDIKAHANEGCFLRTGP